MRGLQANGLNRFSDDAGQRFSHRYHTIDHVFGHRETVGRPDFLPMESCACFQDHVLNTLMRNDAKVAVLCRFDSAGVVVIDHPFDFEAAVDHVRFPLVNRGR